MNKNRDDKGRWIRSECLIDWRVIDFWNEYIPYYEQHTRAETIQHFEISEAMHKSMCKKYNYVKPWNKIHKTVNGIEHAVIKDINFIELKDYYENHTREETCLFFNIGTSVLKYLCKINNYKKPMALIAKNVSTALYDNGYSKNIITFEKIDFYNEYIPYFETHSRKDTCEHFKISESAHKALVAMYDYHKAKYLCVKQAKKKILYNNIYFDSYPEVAYYIWAKDNNKNIIFEPCSLHYTYNDIEYTYFPDFEVDGQLVEIKGDHFFKKDGTMCNPFDHSQDEKYEAKHQCMLKNNVTILTNKEYNFAINYCIITYGDNWINKLNIKKIKKEDIN